MKFIERAWYRKAFWLYLLWPVQFLFSVLSAWRRRVLSSNAKPLPVPLVVVGNINVGGTGKTPLLISLVKHLQAKGFKPGVVSRGYGSEASHYPVHVDAESSVSESGDEALIIARHCACPVVVDPDRVAAVEALLLEYSVDVVLSDDGLQHYAMKRDIEIIVVDGGRAFGNGLCLPAGPLREPLKRLGEASLVAINGSKSAAAALKECLLKNGVVWAGSGVDAADIKRLEGTRYSELGEYAEGFGIKPQADAFINLLSGEKRPYAGAPFKMGSRLQAICGLGNPDRFFEILEELPYNVDRYVFDDHYAYQEPDFRQLNLDSIQPVVMTEKDAVKVQGFAQSNYWYLTIKLKLSERFLAAFDRRLAAVIQSRK